jgi:MtN3 and saliva related transmembrane protein
LGLGEPRLTHFGATRVPDVNLGGLHHTGRRRTESLRLGGRKFTGGQQFAGKMHPCYRCAPSDFHCGERVIPSLRETEYFMAAWFEFVGSVAASCTTLCWLPQSVKIIREKRTDGISLLTQSVFTLGTALWAAYGMLLNNRPVLYANSVTLVFAAAILFLKIRYR